MNSVTKLFAKYLKNIAVWVVCIATSIIAKPNAIAAPYNKATKYSKSSNSSTSELQKMRIGIMLNTPLLRITATGGAFFEYQPTKYWGFSIGLEGGITETFLVPKGLETKFFENGRRSEEKIIELISKVKYNIMEEIGYYKFTVFRIPLEAKIYPWQGNFCIRLGVNMEFLIDQSGLSMFELFRKIANKEIDQKDLRDTEGSSKMDRETQSIEIFSDHSDKIEFDKKNGKNDELFNKFRMRVFLGWSYTTSYGLIFGTKHYLYNQKFVNYDKEYLSPYLSTAEMFEFIIGFDIMKIINYEE